ALAFAFVEIMADGADEAVGVALKTIESVSEHFIRGAVAVDVRSHERADTALVGAPNDAEKAFFTERLAKMHVTSAAPGSVGRACQVHDQCPNKWQNAARCNVRFSRKLPRWQSSKTQIPKLQINPKFQTPKPRSGSEHSEGRRTDSRERRLR